MTKFPADFSNVLNPPSFPRLENSQDEDSHSYFKLIFFSLDFLTRLFLLLLRMYFILLQNE